MKLLLPALILALPASAQTWSRAVQSHPQFGMNDVTVVETPGGGVLLAGLDLLADTSLTWFDASGDMTQQLLLDAGVLGAERVPGGTRLVGREGAYDPAWIAEIDDAGTLLWQARVTANQNILNWSQWEELSVTPDGGTVAAGWRAREDDIGEFQSEAMVHRFYPHGGLVWSRRLGDATGSEYTWATGIDMTSDGTIIVVGVHYSKLFLLGLDAGGGEVFRLKLNVQAWRPKVRALANGGFAVCAAGSSNENNYVGVFTSAGVPRWQHTYPGPSGDTGRAIAGTADGGILLGGRTASFGADTVNGPILKLDATGAVEWQRLVGGPGSQIVVDVEERSAGGALLGVFHQVPPHSTAVAMCLGDMGQSDECALTHLPLAPVVTDPDELAFTEPLVSYNEVLAPGTVQLAPVARTPFPVCPAETIGLEDCSPASVHSGGVSASLVATGSATAGDDLLSLRAFDLPAGQFGMFLAGQSSGQVVPPGASGPLCLSGGFIARYLPVQGSGPNGVFQSSIGTNVPGHGAILAGETWRFQAWFRDVGGTSNFTDVAEIDFQ